MNCSSPLRELVTFWLAGSLGPADAALVSSHVASCAECREAASEGAALVKGLLALHLRADEVVAAAAGDLQSAHLLVCSSCRDEVALLRGINADLAAASGRSVPMSSWRAGLALAAAVIIGVPVVWQMVRPTPELPPPVAPITVAGTPSAIPPTAPRRITVEKASLEPLANESLVLRGASNSRRSLLDALAVALEPYRRNDFEESAKRLRALQRQHRDTTEIPYYLGVCLLLLDRPAEALLPLQEAEARMEGADEVRYYLAVARVNAARTATESEAGSAELARLCGGTTDVAPRACAAQAPGGPAGPR
jgi:hypothetical protein